MCQENHLEIFHYGEPPLPTGKLGKARELAREFPDLHEMLNETPCNNNSETFLTFLCAFVTTTNGYSSSVQLSFLWQAKLLSASTEKYG